MTSQYLSLSGPEIAEPGQHVLSGCSVYISMAKEGQKLTQAGINQESQMSVSHIFCDNLVRKLFQNVKHFLNLKSV